MPRLRSVPDIPPRAVLYIRVSQERDEMTSPALQRVACEDYCTRMGYTVVDVVEDIDLSGRLWRRRQIEQVVQRVEARDVDVIVTWKWSRVARNRKDWAIAVDRVESAGGRFESATEPVDTTTSTGRLARGMLAEFAAFESDRIGDTWKETHARRIREGKPANGRPRFGYRSIDKTFQRHEPEASILADMYRRYIAGASMHSIVAWLNSEGVPTTPGYAAPAKWSPATARRILDSGFGAGLIVANGEHLPGEHDFVITPDEWKAYQAARKRRGHGAGRSERSPYLLSGLVYCACGSRMSGTTGGARALARYRCTAASAAHTHTGGSAACRHVEAVVREWVGGLRLTAAPAAPVRDVERHAREVAALDRQLTDLTRHLLSGLVSEAAYRSTRADIEGQRDALADRLREAELDVARRGAAPQAVRDVVDGWDVLPVENLRELLRAVIDRVVVTARRPRSDVEVVARWELPR